MFIYLFVLVYVICNKWTSCNVTIHVLSFIQIIIYYNWKKKLIGKIADITVSPSLENFVPKFRHKEVEAKRCRYLVLIWSLRSQVKSGPFSESHRTSTIGIWRPLSCFTSCFVISTKSSSINGHFIERNMNVGETFFRFDTWNCRMYVAYFTR